MNPAEQRFNERIYKRLAALEKQMQEIKTSQRMGLDNFVYDISDVVSASAYLENGGWQNYQINFNADTPKLYASELTMSFFINNDLDPDYHWPDGAALGEDTGLSPLDVFYWYDLSYSDETGVGRKTYFMRITNWGAFAKTIHMHAALVFPTGNIT